MMQINFENYKIGKVYSYVVIIFIEVIFKFIRKFFIG